MTVPQATIIEPFWEFPIDQHPPPPPPLPSPCDSNKDAVNRKTAKDQVVLGSSNGVGVRGVLLIERSWLTTVGNSFPKGAILSPEGRYWRSFAKCAYQRIFRCTGGIDRRYDPARPFTSNGFSSRGGGGVKPGFPENVHAGLRGSDQKWCWWDAVK